MFYLCKPKISIQDENVFGEIYLSKPLNVLSWQAKISIKDENVFDKIYLQKQQNGITSKNVYKRA